MTLEIKKILDPDDWGKVVAKAKKAENAEPFPQPPLDYTEIHTRWSSEHHVVIGMRSANERATTGFVQINSGFVDRVFQVPWPE